jgi:transposase
MNCNTRFVGLDVSKETVAVAVANYDGTPAKYIGSYPNRPETILRELKRIGDLHSLCVCYEAGVTGYGLARYLKERSVKCTVAAPSKIERVPGPRVKTDRKDAIMLAEKLRMDNLAPVWVPDEEDEAMRDLIRARKARKEDLTKARQRVAMFLMRHGICKPDAMTSWGTKYRSWLKSLEFEQRAARASFQEYIIAVEEIEQSVRRLEQEIHEVSTQGRDAALIQALQALRGFKETAAATVVAEIGDFRRFRHPKNLMGYAGVVPRESSSGNRVWRGRITKTGSSCLRWILTESSWSYRHKPGMSGAARKRLEGVSPEVQEIAWKAQIRLHRKYNKLMTKNKSHPVAIMAVARELLGFIWAIARQVDYETQKAKGRTA